MADPLPAERVVLAGLTVLRRPWSIQLEATGYRVDEVVVLRADGQAGPGGDAAELGQAPVGDQVHDQAGVERLLVDRDQFFLGVHLDRDLAEAALQPGSLGG